MGILRKTAKSLLIFIVIISWLFNYPPFLYENFGGLRIWENPPIPPAIQETKAAMATYSTATTTVTYTASTTWTAPGDVTAVMVEAWGGGGAGGGNANTQDGGGGGGGELIQ